MRNTVKHWLILLLIIQDLLWLLISGCTIERSMNLGPLFQLQLICHTITETYID